MGFDEIPFLALRSEAVLGRVTKLVKEFIYQACIRRNLSEAAARASGGKIYTFGSYRLGVHGPGSDIDTLVVAPKHVDRQDFMEIFLELLQKDDWVEEANVSRFDKFPNAL